MHGRAHAPYDTLYSIPVLHVYAGATRLLLQVEQKLQMFEYPSWNRCSSNKLYVQVYFYALSTHQINQY